MKIAVTGAAGFIGSWVAEALASRGHDVLGIDDMSGGDNPVPGLVRCDLRDRGATGGVITGFCPDVLAHLAANAREGASQFQPWEVATRNLAAYASVLEASIAAGVRRVVLFSSMAVYGRQRPPVDESVLPAPVDVYGTCKAAMERMTEILSSVHGFRWVVLRPHNVFGERQRMSDRYRNVVAIFMNRIMRGEPLYVYGDGEQRRAFSYISDSLPCYVRAVEDDSLHAEAINVGSAGEITVNRLAEQVMGAMGRRAEVVHIPDRPLEVKDAWCSTEKSVRLLGYREETGLKRGLARMASWAVARGPQEWSAERLALVNESTPRTWL